VAVGREKEGNMLVKY